MTFKPPIVEMSRRGVFRVAGIYAAVAWVVIQLAAVLESSLTLPTWFDALIIGLAALGFPIALVLAWAFEVTPDGVQRARTAEDAIISRTRFYVDSAIVVSLLVVAILISMQLLNNSDTSAPKSEVLQNTQNSTLLQPQMDVGPAVKKIEFALNIRNIEGAPIPNAEVDILENDQTLNLLPYLSDFRGSVSGSIEFSSQSELVVAIAADGYKRQLLPMGTISSKIEIPNVELTPADFLALDGPVHIVSADNKLQFLEIEVRHVGSDSVSVSEIVVSGVKRTHTDCLTGAPSYLVNLNQDSDIGIWTAETINRDEDWSEELLIAGQFEVLPCEQMRMEFRISGLLRFSEEIVDKIRVSVPREIISKDGSSHITNIENWASVIISLVGTDGTIFSTTQSVTNGEHHR